MVVERTSRARPSTGTDDPQTFSVIGAAMEAHALLGHGFLEAVYQEALAIEFGQRGIPYEREVDLPVWYRNQRLGVCYRADFVCFGEVVVELKALAALNTQSESQLLNYLRAARMNRGLIFNFGAPSLEFKRFAL